MEAQNVEICRVFAAGSETRYDHVVREVEVTLKLDGRVLCRLCCYPAHLEELARGHLVAEGIAATDVRVRQRDMQLLVSTGSRSKVRAGQVTSQVSISREQVFDLVKRLDRSGELFTLTGGTHVVGLAQGQREMFVEDVSRHCAIDKAIGLAVKEGLDLSESVLVTSCRQTISTMSKAICAGIPVVVTVAAPTDVAVRDAELFGITLVGFARDNRFNIYTHGWRIAKGV
ncbi:MAG: formate dehydrogenase accessory sulfurtransferase FdhD [Chloroflexota bacterium]|nr:formate dehydrogenase accessory sulfurtransferase FdhD [Chloroflexota bacterium]